MPDCAKRPIELKASPTTGRPARTTSVTSGATLDLKINLACTTVSACFNSTYAGAGTVILEPATTGWAMGLGATSGTNTFIYDATDVSITGGSGVDTIDLSALPVTSLETGPVISGVEVLNLSGGTANTLTLNRASFERTDSWMRVSVRR